MNWYCTSQTSGNFLNDPDSAWEWAKMNVADIEINEESENSEERVMAAEYRERAELYSNAYVSIIKKPEITIYRAIRASSINKIDWNKLGIYWSLKKEGASVLGIAPSKSKHNRDFLITATVSPKFINWEHGFTSFMYYGEDQWEIALISGSPINVIAVDGRATGGKECFASRGGLVS